MINRVAVAILDCSYSKITYWKKNITFCRDLTAFKSYTLPSYFSASLRDLYVDALGNVLTGKLFEDLDALAGNIAYSHCDDNNPLTRPLTLVTGPYLTLF